MDDSTKISRQYCIKNWKNLSFKTEEEWQEGINIFEDRVRSRVLDHVAIIKNQEFAGFAVLALDCLLIETLQQFREGEETSKGGSCKCFVRFLTETSFKNFFTKDMAGEFYDKIRSGILHQSEVKGDSRVVLKKVCHWLRRYQPAMA